MSGSVDLDFSCVVSIWARGDTFPCSRRRWSKSSYTGRSRFGLKQLDWRGGNTVPRRNSRLSQSGSARRSMASAPVRFERCVICSPFFATFNPFSSFMHTFLGCIPFDVVQHPRTSLSDHCTLSFCKSIGHGRFRNTTSQDPLCWRWDAKVQNSRSEFADTLGFPV